MLSLSPACILCKSKKLQVRRHYPTAQNGPRRLFDCNACGACFSETKDTPLEGLKKPMSLVAQVLRARLGGMGFNETAAAFSIARGTLRDWETRFAALAKPLLIYAMSHTFLKQVVEGDELYTKVGENLPPDQSEGWTIVLMDRVSRFVWIQVCGKHDQKLFKKAISQLCKLIKQSKDVTLVTDGERRYGNLLFQICTELVKTGKRGRPKKRSRVGSKFVSRTRARKQKKGAVNAQNTKLLGQSILKLRKI